MAGWLGLGPGPEGRGACVFLVLCLGLSLSGPAFALRGGTRGGGASPLRGNRRARPEHPVQPPDLKVFDPFLRAFHSERPPADARLHRRLLDGTPSRDCRGRGRFDVALSSAMDLQFQLVNDVFAQSYQSSTDGPPCPTGRAGATGSSPSRANRRWWSSRPNASPDCPFPRPAGTHRCAARQIRAASRARSATYDVRDSGLGYLFANPGCAGHGRLLAAGRGGWAGLSPRLYCCSGQTDRRRERRGRLALALQCPRKLRRRPARGRFRWPGGRSCG